MQDPRQRNQRHLSGRAGNLALQLDWACPEQREIFEYGPYPQLASGGFGSGKTWVFCLKIMMLSTVFPGNRGVICRKVHKELEQTTMKTFFKVCPPELYDKGRRSDSEKILRLNCGSEILWMHMEDEDIMGILRGLEINWIFFDQAEEISEEAFDVASARLGRWDQAIVPPSQIEMVGGIDNWKWKNPAGEPIVPTYAMLACNPDSETHWLYTRFHPESPEHYKRKFRMPSGAMASYADLGYKLWCLDSRKNKFLTTQNIEQMMSQDESFVRRFVEGKWGIPEGQIHAIPEESIIEGDPEILDWIRGNCQLYRALDHGDAAPTCCLWFGVDKEGNVFAYREYYQPNEIVSVHREAIYKMSLTKSAPGQEEIEKYRDNLADPSIFYKTQQKYGGRSAISDEWDDSIIQPRKTAISWSPADNDELATRNRINQYLRVDPNRMHPIRRTKGAPRLFFIKASASYPNGCDHVLKETRSQRRLKVGTELGKPIFCDERDDNVVDHAYDPLRYFIASRPPVAPVEVVKPNPMSWNEVSARHDRWLRRGGWQRQSVLQRKRYQLMRGV